MAAIYEVIVGNVGIVHTGKKSRYAHRKFAWWVKDSKTGLGRSGGESVTLMKDGEIVAEYMGAVDTQESFIECGCCGAYHRSTYYGDCRNNAERFDDIPWDAIIVDE